MNKSIEKNRIYAMAICIIILLFCEWYFFRNVIGSTALFGDDGDGRLTMLITEHWFHVLKGEAQINDLGMFYPTPNTLAFSDMFLGFGIIHSILRLCGMNIFAAYKYTLIIVHALGTFATFYLLNNVLKIKKSWALFGTIAFSFSCTYATHILHTQLVAISYVPWAVILIILFFRNVAIKGRRGLYACGAIAVLVLILYTAWYIAFFSALFAVTIFFVWIFLMHSEGKKPVAKIKRFILNVRFELVGYIMFAVVLCIPFALLEIETLKMSGGWNYNSITVYMPELVDIINVTDQNWLLGNIIQILDLNSRNISGEVAEGFSLVLLGIFLISMVRLGKTKDIIMDESKKEKVLLCRTCAVSVLVSIALVVQLSSNGISFWWFIYSFFPGGAAIRAVGRYLLFLSLPMAISATAMADCVERKRKSFQSNLMNGCLISLLIVVLFISNIKIGGAYSAWNSDDSQSFIDSVAFPPSDCETFYIVCDEAEPFLQLDAYQIADHFGIKTLNGYSGIYPNNWDGLWQITGKLYRHSVLEWMYAHEIESTYEYDITNNIWTKVILADKYGALFNAKEKVVPYLVSGLWDMLPEGDYSWTKMDFEVPLQDKKITENGLLLKAGFVCDLYSQQQADIEPRLDIYVNDVLVKSLVVNSGYYEYLFDVDAAKEDIYKVKIKANFYWNPSDLGVSIDARNLSWQLFYLGAAE